MIKNLLILTFLFFSTVSQAGFFIDPHAGYKIAGDAKLAGRTFDHDQIEFGSKFGWHSGATQLGLDLNFIYPTYKAQDQEQTEESFSGMQYGFFMGARLGWIRGWFTWVIGANQTGDVNNEKYKGTGWEFGASVGPQNFPNFFIKYSILQYRTLETSSGVEVDLSNGQELETSAVILGVSWPFSFGKRSRR